MQHGAMLEDLSRRFFAREAAIRYASGIKGWYEPAELRGLWDMCSLALADGGILEVGCFHGRSSSLLALFVQTLGRAVPLIFIDPFQSHFMQGFDIVAAKADFLGHMHEIGVPYRLFEQRSADIPRNELPAGIDLLHVDGDHAKRALETDCEILLPVLRPGGVVCFHDYRPDFPVVEVVDRVCGGWQELGTFGNMRALRRPLGASHGSLRSHESPVNPPPCALDSQRF
jgi:SAM-dependent methyltransferase